MRRDILSQLRQPGTKNEGKPRWDEPRFGLSQPPEARMAGELRNQVFGLPAFITSPQGTS